MTNGPTDSYETQGTYKGPLAMLKGQRADLIIYANSGRCLAQFHKIETGYSAGFHDFATEHFNLDPRP